MSPNTAPTTTLKHKRLIKAPIARVFAAWTTPDELVQWFGPGDWRTTTAKIDLRPGGAYQFSFHSATENRDVEIHGIYHEVKPNTRLAFTWNSSNPQMNFGETMVTVDLVESDGSTEVRITHEGFPADAIRERHAQGWTKACDNLAKLLTEGGVVR